MVSFLKERYPNDSKIWRFSTSALVTDHNMLSFSAIGPVNKVPTVAEVSWRPDLGLISAQYRLTSAVVGLAIQQLEIPTAQFNVFALETWLEDKKHLRKNITLGVTVVHGANVEVLPVALPSDGLTAAFVLGHADVFMYEKVARLEYVPQIQEQGLIC